MQKTILNLTVTLHSDNVIPIDIVINNPEPILCGDDYFTMLQGSCIAHNVGYTSLLELLLVQVIIKMSPRKHIFATILVLELCLI